MRSKFVKWGTEDRNVKKAVIIAATFIHRELLMETLYFAHLYIVV